MSKQVTLMTDAIPYQEFAKLIGKSTGAVRRMIDKRVIDEQDWTITKVTHFLNNSGFTTSLELEVRLSDVEYETEGDE